MIAFALGMAGGAASAAESGLALAGGFVLGVGFALAIVDFVLRVRAEENSE
jgi:hypothetical protein